MRTFKLDKWRPACGHVPRLPDRKSTASRAAAESEKLMLSEDILFLSVTELSRRIRSRQLSPVELTESYLERSRNFGPKLNAYATLTPDLALKQAHAAEKEIAAGKYRGPLHGIPYAAKDLLAVKGYPTTWGARPYADQHFDYDATVVKKLEAAGAVLLGKAAMIELAGGMGYRFSLGVWPLARRKIHGILTTGPAVLPAAPAQLPLPGLQLLPSAQRPGAPSSALPAFAD